MLVLKRRPYLVVPKLINQPTWGGDYILKAKGWSTLFPDYKIGQSYELFSQTKLLIEITDSMNKSFMPDIGGPNNDKIENKAGYKKDRDYLFLDRVTRLSEKIPLIKFTQSNGNSFQLHIKDGIRDSRWQAKPESWYYFEDGLVTYGIKKGANLDAYKNDCFKMENIMNDLSHSVKTGKMTLTEAGEKAAIATKEINLWQYVNLHVVKKNSVVDSSLGGIHHSWEEDIKKYPLGNVLYEVQRDVMDPISTIRSFDKGKMKKDGSVRKLDIEAYFKYLDVDADHNDLSKKLFTKNTDELVHNKYYCLDKLVIDGRKNCSTDNSFVHLFVHEGKIKVMAKDGEVNLFPGHSCFLPETVGEYQIMAEKKTVLLKTFVKNSSY